MCMKNPRSIAKMKTIPLSHIPSCNLDSILKFSKFDQVGFNKDEITNECYQNRPGIKSIDFIYINEQDDLQVQYHQESNDPVQITEKEALKNDQYVIPHKNEYLPVKNTSTNEKLDSDYLELELPPPVTHNRNRDTQKSPKSYIFLIIFLLFIINFSPIKKALTSVFDFFHILKNIDIQNIEILDRKEKLIVVLNINKNNINMVSK